MTDTGFTIVNEAEAPPAVRLIVHRCCPVCGRPATKRPPFDWLCEAHNRVALKLHEKQRRKK